MSGDGVEAGTGPGLNVAHFERGLAELSVSLLRSAGVSDVEILCDYTIASPRADAAYERVILQDHGVHVAALRVKRYMRRLLTN